MGCICIALRNLDANGPPSGNLHLWTKSRRFLENLDVFNTKISSLQFQVPLWKVLCEERGLHGPHGTTGRKTLVPIQGKTLFVIKLCVCISRIHEAAELLYCNCVTTNTSVLTLV